MDFAAASPGHRFFHLTEWSFVVEQSMIYWAVRVLVGIIRVGILSVSFSYGLATKLPAYFKLHYWYDQIIVSEVYTKAP